MHYIYHENSISWPAIYTIGLMVIETLFHSISFVIHCVFTSKQSFIKVAFGKQTSFEETAKLCVIYRELISLALFWHLEL